MVYAKLTFAAGAALASAAALAAGSVVIDSTLPGHASNTTINPANGTYTIPSSQGFVSGSGNALNLFHSFLTFNVDTGETAQFTNDQAATYASGSFSNIISRVTGGTPSTINGTIDSTAFTKANFWFINPAGVTVGATAQMNVPAGLAIGSADYVQFADNSRWYALANGSPTPSVLSTADPKSFGFLNSTSAGAVSINGLAVPASAQLPYVYLEGTEVDLINADLTADPATGTGTVLLVGKTVSVTGSKISSPNGLIGIAAVASLADLAILPVQSPADFLFGNSSAPNATKTGLVNSFGATLGAVTLTNSYVHTDGNAGGGGIYILGGQIQAGGNLGTGPVSFANGLDASADAETPAGSPATFGVHVYGQSFEMDGNNQIDSIARGAGDSGPVDIALTGDLVLDGTHDAASLGAAGTPGVTTYSTAIFSEARAAGNGGDIDIVANDMSLVGPTSPPPSLAANTNGGPGSPTVSSFSSSAGNAGNISITLGGTLEVSGFGWQYGRLPSNPTVSGPGIGGGFISADGFDGTSGNVTITATSVELHDGAQISSAALGSGGAGNIDITLSGGHLLMDSDPRAVFGSGIFSKTAAPTGAAAGNISITATAPQPADGYVTISDSRILSDASLSSGAAGSVTISASGPIQVSRSTIDTTVVDSYQDAGAIALSAGGLIDISGTQIVSSSSGGTGNGGQISISGSGVFIGGNSLVKADFENPGGDAGAPGSVAIFSTGQAAADDPLAGNLATATPGVVRIVDSGVTAVNSGGLGVLQDGVAAGGNLGDRGQIWIGESRPSAGTVTVADDVVAAGSVFSNDVSAGGLGSNLTVIANHGVWIGPAPAGQVAYPSPDASGAFPDPRPGAATGTQTQSLISAQTDNSAASGGQVLIQGGDRGVTVVNSIVDANDQTQNNPSDPRLGYTPTQSNIVVSVGTTDGPVTLSNGVITTETSGVNPAGDIAITGGSVSINGGKLSAASSSPSKAGNISVTSTAADAPDGTASLQIDGAIVQSTANGTSTQSTSVGNAGTISIQANVGSVSLGDASGTSATTQILTSANPGAGQAGSISIQSANANVGLSNVSVDTSVATGEASDASGTAYAPATIQLGAPKGAVSVVNSAILAQTHGAVRAGDISIFGSTIQVTGTGTLISASTTTADPASLDGFAMPVNSGSAGVVSLAATGPTLTVSSGATVSSDASAGRAGANAGYVSLFAPNGTVQVGLASDAVSSVLSTSVGALAGSPGAVTIQGPGIDLEDARIATTTASIAYLATTRGSIVLNANSGTGLLKVANSQLDAATSGLQQAGEIDLQGAPIQISDSMISSATTGTGAAGAICVSAGCVGVAGYAGVGGRGVARQVLASASSVAGAGISISGSTLSTATSTSGPAGNITVITPGALTLSGTTIDSQSTSTAADAGPVGVINLSSGSVSLSGSTVSAISKGGTAVASGGVPPGAAITISSAEDSNIPIEISGSTITTQAAVTNGDNIVVNAGDSQLLLSNSQVSASATGGNGGNITVTDVGNTVLKGSQIVAQAGPGNGGAINIGLMPGSVFVQDSGSLVSATSRTGNNGTVTINSPQTDLNSALRVPVVSVAHAPELMASVCRHDNNRSTFVREGRGGVTQDPQGYLSENSPLAAALPTPPLLFAAGPTATATTECP